IRPFELADTAGYIASRIRIAGGDARRLFTREAVMVVQEYSRGIPRSISVICDNALLGGFAAGRQPVGRDIVEEVARDFDLGRTPPAADPAPEPAVTPVWSRAAVGPAEAAPPSEAAGGDARDGAPAQPEEVPLRHRFSMLGRL
ncbi:MAG: hypothetical protein ABIM89_01950, partial [Mycobacteriales bacterium]